MLGERRECRRSQLQGLIQDAPRQRWSKGTWVQMRGQVYGRAALKAQQQISLVQRKRAVCYTRRYWITLKPQRSNLKGIGKYTRLSMLGELQRIHHAKTQGKERIQNVRKKSAKVLEKEMQHRKTLLVQNILCLREYCCRHLELCTG